MTYVLTAFVVGGFVFASIALLCGTWLHIFHVTNKQKEEAYKNLQDAMDKYSNKTAVSPGLLSSLVSPPQQKKVGN